MAGLHRLATTGRTARASTGRVLAGLALAAVATGALTPVARADEPHDWQLGFQRAATPVQARLEAFNNELTIIIGLITVVVLGLLLYTVVRFDHRRHPVPTHTEHNLVLEILWTLIPVVILVIIAVPSFKLMYYMARVPKSAMTIKVTAHQWYWSYAYPDQGGLTFDSNLVQEANLKPGQPRLLTVDNPLVVPVDTNIRVLITSTDVMHDWFVPSFGVQEYAIIGRINETWFNVERPGTYRGQCDQLCGLNHAFMPIEVKAVPKDQFQRWLIGAKKQFAHNDSGGGVRVAAAAGSLGAGRSAAAGN
ncbi:MAG: cytochrome c oxidase subunit II [Stellaceae bacterium]